MDDQMLPSQQDEGYSEDPLNPASLSAVALKSTSGGAVSGSEVRSNAEFQAWFSRNAANLSTEAKTQLTLQLLDGLPTSVIAEIVQRLNPRLYIDFIHYLPAEVCLRILDYLDPLSLLNVARACRAWYSLAVDPRLWEALFHLEGWQSRYNEIRLGERMINESSLSGVREMHRIRSSEDAHSHKKRAISASPARDADRDLIMVDVDQPMQQEPGEMTGEESSIFGRIKTNSAKSGLSQNMKMLDMHSSRDSVKGKSRERTLSPFRPPSFVKAESMPEMVPSTIPPTGVPKSTLWMWDAHNSRYRMNWKYLYSMRRKLEYNWEQGRFKNFQFPHPDYPLEGHTECIYSLQYDAKYLVSGSRDRTLRIWDLETRRLVRKPLVGHNGSVLCLQFDSDPQEDLIVSGSSDSDIILWRFSTGEIIQRLRNAHGESVLNVRFDSRILVTCSKDKTIKVFNRRNLYHGDLGYPNGVYPVPIHLRKYGADLPLLREQMPVVPAFSQIGCLEGHNAAVNAVQIFDREIVSASGDRNIKVWDWPTEVCERTIFGHNKGIACVQYDGRRIVSGSSDNEVKIFDRKTSCEVASLRCHSALVRTVQAGFGDLPYSVEDDLEEARRVDKAYHEAEAAGLLEHLPRRGRIGNAGSRRPEDITAYGAKLPPGGGGGKYGRIVSGSYDQTIIIWRRDKEGVWKDQQRLKQEEAVLAARAPRAGRNGDLASVIPLHPSVRPPAPPPVIEVDPAASNGVSSQPDQSSAAATSVQPAAHQITHVEQPIMAALTPSAVNSYHQIIDTVVPQGPSALSRALASYPNILTQRVRLQAAIDREQSPFTRSALRQVVNTAMVRTQMEQAQARQRALQSVTQTLENSAAAGDSAAGPSGTAASSLAQVPSAHGIPRAVSAPATGARQLVPSSSPPRHTQPNPVSIQQLVGAPLPVFSTPSITTPATANVLPSIQQQNPATHPPPPQNPHHPHIPHITAHHGNAQPQGGAPGQGQQPQDTAQDAAQAQAQQAANANNVEAAHNPRVFKLQFDARRIICCSQTSEIVGWDFCNGDPELEEASRFFEAIQ